MTHWTYTTAIFLVSLAFSWAAGYITYRLVLTRLIRDETFWRPLFARTRGPVQLQLMIMAISFAANAAPLPLQEGRLLRHLLLIAFIACITWFARTALEIWMTLHLRRFRLDVEDNLLARKHVTQSRILQRVGSTLILAIGVSAALMTIESVRQYGVSLLASAGAAGIIVGFALQPVLRNVFAGLQLALTQPIRIDDAVIVEGEWGNVEEITATYVVVRLWDKRGLIVPLNYFMEQPFQNWTRKEATLIGVVFVYVDFTTDLAQLREEARKIVSATPLWNGEVFAVQVTDFSERTVEVRILADAANAGNAFDLRCYIREAVIGYLAEAQPHALPQARFETSTQDSSQTEDKPRLLSLQRR